MDAADEGQRHERVAQQREGQALLAERPALKRQPRHQHRRAAAELGGARASRPPARTPRALKVCWTIAGPSVCIYAQGMRS